MISAKKFREQIDTCQGAGYSNLLKHMEEISKTIMIDTIQKKAVLLDYLLRLSRGNPTP